MMISGFVPTAPSWLIIGVSVTVRLGWMKGAIKRSLKKPNIKIRTAVAPMANPNKRELKCCFGFSLGRAAVFARTRCRILAMDFLVFVPFCFGGCSFTDFSGEVVACSDLGAIACLAAA